MNRNPLKIMFLETKALFFLKHTYTFSHSIFPCPPHSSQYTLNGTKPSIEPKTFFASLSRLLKRAFLVQLLLRLLYISNRKKAIYYVSTPTHPRIILIPVLFYPRLQTRWETSQFFSGSSISSSMKRNEVKHLLQCYQ